MAHEPNLAVMESRLTTLQGVVQEVVEFQRQQVTVNFNIQETMKLLQQSHEELRGAFSPVSLLLQGDNGKLGVLAQHRIMWRIHVWVLCAASTAIGSLITIGLQHYMKQ